jgi:hypothetical protein
MKRVLESFVTVVALALVMALAGCGGGDTGPAGATGAPGATGTPGASGEVTNATCLSANCHGNASLVKTIVRNDAGKEGVVETIPLYVDNTLFTATVHGGQRCVGCHSDINAAGGAHGPVVKTYGGWARFSAAPAIETIATNEIARTRNYITAASRSCVTCHSNHAGFSNSAHVTIFKQRNAKVDTALRTAAQAAFPGDNVPALGEDYLVGDCNRCHASCSTCHFKSTIKRALAGNPLNFWDNNMTASPAAGWSDKMTEFSMDWTTNVASHEFRNGSYFLTDAEGVCEACHTGLYKPAQNAYYWADAAKTTVKKVKATDGKRHMQVYELLISGIGNTAVLTGGNNTAHAGFACAVCHGGSVGDLHALPGLPYLWDAPTYPQGDVHCTDCHSAAHTNGAVALHLDNTGTSVACVGCHAFGMARDFELKKNGTSTSTDVFLDPKSNQVRPVIYKHGLAEAWYPHNWQTLNPGTGLTDPAGDCAKKCHYSGNPVGAFALP